MSRHFFANIRRLLRNLALVLGILMLFWLPVEDTSERWVILFAAAICALAAAFWFVSYNSAGERRSSRLTGPTYQEAGTLKPQLLSSELRETVIYPLAGAIAGLAITPMALFLMAFKSGIHGHGAPDFTPDQVTSVIIRTPIWAGAGFLIGLGVALLRRIK